MLSRVRHATVYGPRHEYDVIVAHHFVLLPLLVDGLHLDLMYDAEVAGEVTLKSACLFSNIAALCILSHGRVELVSAQVGTRRVQDVIFFR